MLLFVLFINKLRLIKIIYKKSEKGENGNIYGEAQVGKTHSTL